MYSPSSSLPNSVKVKWQRCPGAHAAAVTMDQKDAILLLSVEYLNIYSICSACLGGEKTMKMPEVFTLYATHSYTPTSVRPAAKVINQQSHNTPQLLWEKN